MKWAFVFCMGICLFGTTLHAQKQSTSFSKEKAVDSLIKIFQSNYFDNRINKAEIALEDYQKLAIPKFIAMLYNTKKVGVNPGDPYTFFANANCTLDHYSWTLDYNIDWLSIRASWFLEELTFMDFGYSSQKIVTSNGMGQTKVTWKKIATQQSLMVDRKKMADQVAAWWKKNEATWTRLGAIKEALESKNNRRIEKAVNFIKYGKSKCDGLTIEAFETSIKPILKPLLQTVDGDLKSKIESIVNEGSVRDDLRTENN